MISVEKSISAIDTANNHSIVPISPVAALCLMMDTSRGKGGHRSTEEEAGYDLQSEVGSLGIQPRPFQWIRRIEPTRAISLMRRNSIRSFVLHHTINLAYLRPSVPEFQVRITQIESEQSIGSRPHVGGRRLCRSASAYEDSNRIALGPCFWACPFDRLCVPDWESTPDRSGPSSQHSPIRV